MVYEFMHHGCSVSRVSPRAKMTQDICSVPSSFPVISVEHTLIVDPVIQRNAHFAYPENLLLSMTTEIVSIYANWQLVAFLKVHSSSRTSVVRHQLCDISKYQNSGSTHMRYIT